MDPGKTQKRGSLGFEVGPDGNLVNNGANVERLRTLWLDRSVIDGELLGPGDPGDFDSGAWHVSCHLVAAGGVRRTAHGQLLWLEISYDAMRDRYYASVTRATQGEPRTLPLESAECEEIVAGSTLLGFVEGNSTGRISARGVVDPDGAFNGNPRQEYDKPPDSPEEGGKVWEHWCTLRDIRPSAAIGSSVLVAYVALLSVLGDAFAAIHNNGDTACLIYYISDNPRISRIQFDGLTIFTPDTLLGEMRSQAGQVANFNDLTNDLKNIEQMYKDKGFTLARARLVNIDSLTGLVNISIDEGRINQITVDGNIQTKRWVILRDFHMKPGELFSEHKAQRSLDDLYGTGYFETVKLSALPCSSGVDLNIKVMEKSFDFIRGSIRYDNEYKAAGSIDLVGSNILGLGNEFYITAQPGEKKRGLTLTLKADRIFRTYLTYKITGSYSEFKRNYYIDHEFNRNLSEIASNFEFELGQQIPRFGKFSTVLNVARYRYISPESPKRETTRRISLSLRSLVDTFDSMPLPERGKYHYFDLEFAGDVFGGDLNYTKFYTSLEAYYPLLNGLNFHPRASVGMYNKGVPHCLLFDLGGRDSFYGLFDHELMGEKVLNGSLELRQKLTGYLYVAARYDIGDFWSRIDSIKLKNLRQGYGGSVILKTFFGPVGLAYGRTTKGQEAFYLYAGYDY